MKNSDSKNKSFFAVLVKNFIGFTFAFVVLVFSIYYVEGLVEEGILKIPRTDKLVAQETLLKKEQYNKINGKKFLGENGYFEILDKEYHPIYTDDKGIESIDYTEGEIACMQDYYGGTTYYEETFYTDNNEKRMVISEYNTSREMENSDNVCCIVLDQDLNVVYSTKKLNYTKLTKREHSFMVCDPDSKYYVTKYEFTTIYGQKRILVMHVSQVSDKVYRKVDKMYNLLLPIFIFFYIILTMGFICRMNKKVKKPLLLLNEAMYHFTEGNRAQAIEYHGATEFEQICDNFNVMSTKLTDSEKKEKKLADEKQKMLTDISHDLKTPITVIQGYSKAICDGLISEDQKEKYLNTIYHKSVQLTDLINTFYEYSKIEHPDFEMVKQKIDIMEWLREYVAKKYEEIELAEFELDADIPENVVSVFIDGKQMERAIENIIANALKHNPKGTTLFVEAKVHNNKVEIMIGDSGVGIDPKIADTIFEPFVVGDDCRNNNYGSGLGLAISRKIVEANEGTITLERRVRKGITKAFILKLPKVYE